MKKVAYDYIVEGSLVISKPTLPDGEELIIMGKIDDDCYEPIVTQSADSEAGDNPMVPQKNIFYQCNYDELKLQLDEIDSFGVDLFPLIRDENHGKIPIAVNSDFSVEVMYNVMKVIQKEKKIDAYLKNSIEYIQLEQEITEIAVKYNLVTKFTSLILTSKNDKLALDSEGSPSADHPLIGAADSIKAGDSNYYHEKCNVGSKKYVCYYELDLATPNEYCNEIRKNDNRVMGPYGCECSRNAVLTNDLPGNHTDAFQNLEKMPGYPRNENECIFGQRNMWCRTADGKVERRKMQFTNGKDTHGRYQYTTGNNKKVQKFCSRYWRDKMAYREHRILMWRYQDQDEELILWNGED